MGEFHTCQPLFNHLKRTAKLALSTIEYYWPAACRRFFMSGLVLEPDRLERIVELAAMTHDVGKGADQYLRKYQNPYPSIGKPELSYANHELPSAAITWKLAYKLGFEVEERVLTFMAVLQHMNTMRDWLRYRGQTRRAMGRFESWSFFDCGEEIERFLVQELGVTTELNVRSTEVFEYIAHVKRGWLQDPRIKWCKLYCLVLAPILVGDNIDAYDTRADDLTGSRRLFVEELRAAAGESSE